ncbi:transcriptional regulator with XRE-family HTH domain [Roseospira marina]|nr:transcriptional regulator with XRE-family HTH domain [Roseospira marina]MBB5089321.1 transcriptional regulator with XRE-family HTH domain [Roseospira marina]
MTRKDLAARAHCTESQITKLERGERRLSADWIVRLSRALNTSAADLVEVGPGPAPATEAYLGEAVELVFRRVERQPLKFDGISAAEFAAECVNLARDLRAIRSAPKPDDTHDHADQEGSGSDSEAPPHINP